MIQPDVPTPERLAQRAVVPTASVILMRVSARRGSWTSGVFQRLMAEAFPEIDTLKVGRLLLNYVLSDPYIEVAQARSVPWCCTIDMSAEETSAILS